MRRFARTECPPSGVYFSPKRTIYDPRAPTEGHEQETAAYCSQETFRLFPVFAPNIQTRNARQLFPSQTGLQSQPFLPHPPLQSPPEKLCLPLLEVDVRVEVYGTIAETTLTQCFLNESDDTISEAHYTFPLYDGSVVTSFLLGVEGRKRVGRVKPREQARDEFRKAVEQRRVAALLDEYTPEIFETSVGNIPPKSSVVVAMTYVKELRVAVLDGRQEGLDVVVPMSIAPRYGSQAGQYPRPPALEGNGLRFEICVNHNGTLQGLQSTSGHAIDVDWNVRPKTIEVASLRQLGEEAAATQTIAKYHSSKTIMDEDFAVTIKTLPEYPIRSRAVLSSPNELGHAALMVNIKPSEIFQNDAEPEAFEGEIIFVLDRSGSMDWVSHQPDGKLAGDTKIATLRRALPLSLASLPRGCTFNIISFGSNCQFMWERSQPNTPENNRFAHDYAAQLKANMGGTELCFALKEAVRSRLQDKATQIILVTDGEVEDSTIVAFVAETRREFKDRVRFFALGVGEQVSHRLILSIGELGGGYSEVVNIQAYPRWEDHLIRMLKFGIMPATWTCDIELGPNFERRSLLNYRLGDKTPADGSTPYVQAPYPTPPLHPFVYRSIFFLLDIGSRTPPQQVALRCTGASSKMGTEHHLPVEPTWTDKPIIHQLAAKAALVSLEAESSHGQPSKVEVDVARQNAEKLGGTYSIASKWTSFIAIDEETQESDEITAIPATLDNSRVQELLGGPASIRGPRTEKKVASAWKSLPRTPGPVGFPPSDFASPLGVFKHQDGNAPTFASTAPTPTTMSSSWESDSGPEFQLAPGSLLPGSALIFNPEHVSRLANVVQVEASGSHSDGSNVEPPDWPTLWQDAADAQDDAGLFTLSGLVREKLQDHFCANTAKALSEALARYGGAQLLEEEEHAVIIDTLMMVQYIKTQAALGDSMWDPMVHRAECAVIHALGLSEEGGAGGSSKELAALQKLLELSIRHAKSIPVACPVCGDAPEEGGGTAPTGGDKSEEKRRGDSQTNATTLDPQALRGIGEEVAKPEIARETRSGKKSHNPPEEGKTRKRGRRSGKKIRKQPSSLEVRVTPKGRVRVTPKGRLQDT